MDYEVLKKLIVKTINLNGLAHGIIDDVLEPALKKVVADTSNPYDDALVVALYPVLELEAKKYIDEYVDLGKLLGIEEE